MIEKIKNTKYCKECQKKLEEEKKAKGIKTIICIDCGKEFITSSKNNNNQRCNECQKEYKKERDKIRQQGYRKENT